MIVYGKNRADEIKDHLHTQIINNNLTPHLAIILASENQASKTYIKYKQIAALDIGITISVYNFIESELKECRQTIEFLNSDIEVYGVIVQLPMYPSWPTHELVESVNLEKDVDGFRTNSLFTPATGEAVWEMLNEFATIEKYDTVDSFLQNKQISVLGKGKTAGKPIANVLRNHNINFNLIDSKTLNPDSIIQQSDIVISATGIKNIINGQNIKKDSYIIGVGVGKETFDGENKIYGDINEDEIKNIAKLYCPTIGGIGPLTIACLLQNVVIASQKQQDKV
ncbi:MAG: bifunctional 5,10-methylenetetrahydrofolate dehydrogenase/5,10-methenyltetrahydrofolate cyclohydrolase [bacterium]|nr:bifunctional 5,10-methylenetetrahydrofolate dehydrogenase/5,10-methenyltetrahydrofolate cyclohydrolase [bacterium]